MNELQIRAVAAGICFGAWPILMNRSHLNGYISPAPIGLVLFVGSLPLALLNFGKIRPDTVWTLAIVAAILILLGNFPFAAMLEKAPRSVVSSLIVLMVVTQIVVPALYQIFLTRKITVSQVAGFTAAALAAFFLRERT